MDFTIEQKMGHSFKDEGNLCKMGQHLLKSWFMVILNTYNFRATSLIPALGTYSSSVLRDRSRSFGIFLDGIVEHMTCCVALDS